MIVERIDTGDTCEPDAERDTAPISIDEHREGSIIPCIRELEQISEVDLQVLHDKLMHDLEQQALEVLHAAVTVRVGERAFAGDALHDIEIEHVPPLLNYARRLRAAQYVMEHRR